MKNLGGYECNGQLTLWDLFKPEKPNIEPNDSICEGCKWRKYKNRYLEVDEYGQTWVYCCPGTACTNWRNGTPLNLSCQDHKAVATKQIYCYNRNFLPNLQTVISLVEAEFDIKFQEYTDFKGRTAYKRKYKKVTLEIHDSAYTCIGKEGVRFVSASWDYSMGGAGMPCDNMKEVFRMIRVGIMRAEEIDKELKARKGKNGEL